MLVPDNPPMARDVTDSGTTVAGKGTVSLVVGGVMTEAPWPRLGEGAKAPADASKDRTARLRNDAMVDSNIMITDR